MEGFPPTQRLPSEDDDEMPEDISSSPETGFLVRANAGYMGSGWKQPRQGKRPPPAMSCDSDSEESSPDLGIYFAKWNMEDRDIIVMCRSYASYIDRRTKATKK